MKRSRMEKPRKQSRDGTDEQPWDDPVIDNPLVNSNRNSSGNAEDETEFQLTDWLARLK